MTQKTLTPATTEATFTEKLDEIQTSDELKVFKETHALEIAKSEKMAQAVENADNDIKEVETMQEDLKREQQEIARKLRTKVHEIVGTDEATEQQDENLPPLMQEIKYIEQTLKQKRCYWKKEKNNKILQILIETCFEALDAHKQNKQYLATIVSAMKKAKRKLTNKDIDTLEKETLRKFGETFIFYHELYNLLLQLPNEGKGREYIEQYQLHLPKYEGITDRSEFRNHTNKAIGNILQQLKAEQNNTNPITTAEDDWWVEQNVLEAPPKGTIIPASMAFRAAETKNRETNYEICRELERNGKLDWREINVRTATEEELENRINSSSGDMSYTNILLDRAEKLQIKVEIKERLLNRMYKEIQEDIEQVVKKMRKKQAGERRTGDTWALENRSGKVANGMDILIWLYQHQQNTKAAQTVMLIEQELKKDPILQNNKIIAQAKENAKAFRETETAAVEARIVERKNITTEQLIREIEFLQILVQFQHLSKQQLSNILCKGEYYSEAIERAESTESDEDIAEVVKNITQNCSKKAQIGKDGWKEKEASGVLATIKGEKFKIVASEEATELQALHKITNRVAQATQSDKEPTTFKQTTLTLKQFNKKLSNEAGINQKELKQKIEKL